MNSISLLAHDANRITRTRWVGRPGAVAAFVLALTVACLTTGCGERECAPAPRPNVVLLLADDLGFGDSRAYNPDSAISMPNLEALAESGMRFTNAHSPAAICAPSRYGVLTGNYAFRGRHDIGVWSAYAEPMVLPGQETLGDAFRAAGYRTAMFGKLNNGGRFHSVSGTGYAEEFAEIDFTRPFDGGPLQMGFDESFLLPVGIQRTPFAFFANDRLVRGDGRGGFKPFTDPGAARAAFVHFPRRASFNGGRIPKPGHAMADYDSREVGPILAARAAAFLERALRPSESGEREPFFLYYAAQAAHGPWTPPAQLMGTRIGGATRISARADMIFEIDVVLGVIVERLRRAGALGDTVIVVTSDNGVPASGAISEGPAERGGPVHRNGQGVVDGVPLRMHKGSIYEGGQRVPLVVRWGDGSRACSPIAPGSTSGQLVGLQDLLATLAGIAGFRPAADQALDSRDLRPILFDRQPEGVALRDHLIVQSKEGASLGSGGKHFARALYEPDADGRLWKLVVSVDTEHPDRDVVARELYELSADPGESRDRFADAEAQPRLAAMTARYRSLVTSARSVPQPEAPRTQE
jgi:arylsulfatase A-like enzyme